MMKLEKLTKSKYKNVKIECKICTQHLHIFWKRISKPLKRLRFLQMQNCGKRAIDEEIKSIRDNNTWTITDLPPNTKHISCKWVL